MFGRNKNSENSDPSLLDDLNGYAVAQNYGHEPLNGAFIGDGNIYWEAVEDPEIVKRGLPFKRIGPDGTYSYHTADEYQRALDVDDEDLRKEGGYRRDVRLERLDGLMGQFGKGQAAGHHDEDDKFEIEIDKIEGLKIKGKGTLARLLQGDAVAQQPSVLDQLIMQRMAGGALTQDNNFMPVGMEDARWSGYRELTSRIEETPYRSGEWDDTIDADIYEEGAEPAPWESGVAELATPEYEETSTVSRQADEQPVSLNKPTLQEAVPAKLSGEHAASKKEKVARKVADWLWRRQTLKLAAGYVIVMTPPVLVHNHDIPDSLHEAVWDYVHAFPQGIGDIANLVHIAARIKGIIPG